MTKAVLFDFDETLQDRTLAFEGYMDAFLPVLQVKFRKSFSTEIILPQSKKLNFTEICLARIIFLLNFKITGFGKNPKFFRSRFYRQLQFFLYREFRNSHCLKSCLRQTVLLHF